MSKIKPVKSSYVYDGLKVTLETNCHAVDQVLEAFDAVLRGSGFNPKGVLTYDEEA